MTNTTREKLSDVMRDLISLYSDMVNEFNRPDPYSDILDEDIEYELAFDERALSDLQLTLDVRLKD